MKPLLLDFAVSRKKDKNPIYSYDEELNLNIINQNVIKVPFIESKNSDLELVTKTKVIREQDDIDLDLLVLDTKTEVRIERDDIDENYLELTTKIRIDREKDGKENIIDYK